MSKIKLKHRWLVRRSKLFDSEWYLRQYPDVARGKIDPLSHYLRYGAAERRDPNPLFWSRWYLDRRPDVAATDINPLVHYVLSGSAEGAQPNPLFLGEWYRRNYADAAAMGLDPLAHYLLYGLNEDRSPHPLFDACWYRHNYGSQLGEQYLLTHYLREGEDLNLRPNPMFEPLYYRATYLDNFNEGALEHYFRNGQAANRWPSPQFQPRLYLKQLPDDEREQYKNRALEHYLLLGIHRKYRTDFRFSTATISGRHINARRTRFTVLVVVHSFGGGVERHVRDIIELHAGLTEFVVLRGLGRGHVVVEEASSEGATLFTLPLQMAEIIGFLSERAISLVHIHHLHGMEIWLEKIISALNLPFYFTVHDYYTLFPQPHLANPHGFYVGEQALEESDDVAGKPPFSSSSDVHVSSLLAWRQMHTWIFTNAASIIVPSVDTAKRIQRYFPYARLRLLHHPEVRPDVRAVPLESGDTLRIAVLGHLSIHKGFHNVRRTAERLRSQDLPISLWLCGWSHDDDALAQSGVNISGRYKENDLGSIIQRVNPHLLWYPSIVPETFSYTLSAGLKSGLPIAVSRLGALPERVVGRQWTWIVPYEASVEELTDFFCLIMRKNLIPGKPPILPEYDRRDAVRLREALYPNYLATPANMKRSDH